MICHPKRFVGGARRRRDEPDQKSWRGDSTTTPFVKKEQRDIGGTRSGAHHKECNKEMTRTIPGRVPHADYQIGFEGRHSRKNNRHSAVIGRLFAEILTCPIQRIGMQANRWLLEMLISAPTPRPVLCSEALSIFFLSSCSTKTHQPFTPES